MRKIGYRGYVRAPPLRFDRTELGNSQDPALCLSRSSSTRTKSISHSHRSRWIFSAFCSLTVVCHCRSRPSNRQSCPTNRRVASGSARTVSMLCQRAFALPPMLKIATSEPKHQDHLEADSKWLYPPFHPPRVEAFEVRRRTDEPSATVIAQSQLRSAGSLVI